MQDIFKKEQILLSKKTQFNLISVVKRGNTITLWSGSNKQTEIIVDGECKFIPNLEYSRSSFFSLACLSNPQSILVLGLGGGAIPSMLHSVLPKAQIDIVEIDHEIVRIAQKYFYFATSDKVQVYINDAFFYLRDTDKQYDLIIMDTYIGNQLPESVDSTAFIAEVNRVMLPNGVYVANLMSANKKLFNNILKRINQIFNNIWLLPGIVSTNTLIFATRNPVLKQDILRRLNGLIQLFPVDLNFSRMASRLERFYLEGDIKEAQQTNELSLKQDIFG